MCLALTAGPQVAIIVDDMIDTGNKLSLAAKSLQENGAKTIYAIISHGMRFADGGRTVIDASGFF